MPEADHILHRQREAGEEGESVETEVHEVSLSVEENVSVSLEASDLAESISIQIQEEPALERMPSPSSLERRCCPTAIHAVDRGHIGCLSGMASEGGVERSGRVEAERRLFAVDENGESALHVATRKGDEEAAKLLLSLAPSLREQQSLSGETAALLAAALGRKELLRELLSGEDSARTSVLTDINGTSVLMAAVVRGDNETAMWLLKKYGKVLAHLPNRSRMLPIHVAAAQGNVDFVRAALKVDPKLAQARDEFGCTPALYAVQGGCLTTLRFLVEKGKANIHATTYKGQSLLHVACITGHDGLVRYLLAKMGSSAVAATTKERANAVHCAAFSGRTHILAMLLGCFGKRKRKEVLSARDSRGNTPLHLAAVGNHVDTALFLVEAGAETQLLNGAQQTAREVALLKGNGHLAGVLAVAHKKWKKRRALVPVPPTVNVVMPYNPSQSRSLHDLSAARPHMMTTSSNPAELYAYLAAEQYATQERHPSAAYSSPIRVHIERSPGGYSSAESFAQTSPVRVVPLLLAQKSPISPRPLSSGYSSAGESHEPRPELTKRLMRYVDSVSSANSDEDPRIRRKQIESFVQTDDDELQENIKAGALSSIDNWRTLALCVILPKRPNCSASSYLNLITLSKVVLDRFVSVIPHIIPANSRRSVLASQVVDDATWMSAGLHAVAALDQVLKECPSISDEDCQLRRSPDIPSLPLALPHPVPPPRSLQPVPGRRLRKKKQRAKIPSNAVTVPSTPPPPPTLTVTPVQTTALTQQSLAVAPLPATRRVSSTATHIIAVPSTQPVAPPRTTHTTSSVSYAVPSLGASEAGFDGDVGLYQAECLIKNERGYTITVRTPPSLSRARSASYRKAITSHLSDA